MSLKEQGGGGREEKSRLFWWPCPMCRLWHQTRLAEALLEGESVEVRCPVNGRTVERPIQHRPRHSEGLAHVPRAGFFRRLFGRTSR